MGTWGRISRANSSTRLDAERDSRYFRFTNQTVFSLLIASRVLSPLTHLIPTNTQVEETLVKVATKQRTLSRKA